jgi:ABC-type glycerol-3-phosphate transport system permease component
MATVERTFLKHTVSHIFLWMVGITTLVPFIWMVLTSLKSEEEVFQSHLLPREVTLGDEGDTLRAKDGQPILSVSKEPIRITLGNPVMVGAPGDPIRDRHGKVIYDPDGQPIPIKNVAVDDGVVSYKNRSSPVMLNGRPLILTERLRALWREKANRPESLKLEDGTVVRRPNGLPYTYKECSWDRVGAPVLDLRTRQPILSADNRPIRYEPAFPILRGDNDPLIDHQGNEVRGVFPGERESRVIYGSDIQKKSRLRFMASNYVKVLRDPDIRFSLYGWNSFFVAVTVMVAQVITAAMAGFAFARLVWPGRDTLFLLYLGTMMIPGVVTMLPNYIILKTLGWLDSFYALIIPATVTAFGTFMMRQFMLGLPQSLEEAAMIDGASLWRVFWTVTIPLSKPALITLAIFTFTGTWQSFTWPLIVTHSEHLRVLPVALRYFDSSQGTTYSLLMTGSVVMMLPMILLFIFGQRFFVRGIQLGALKG